MNFSLVRQGPRGPPGRARKAAARPSPIQGPKSGFFFATFFISSYRPSTGTMKLCVVVIVMVAALAVSGCCVCCCPVGGGRGESHVAEGGQASAKQPPSSDHATALIYGEMASTMPRAASAHGA